MTAQRDRLMVRLAGARGGAVTKSGLHPTPVGSFVAVALVGFALGMVAITWWSRRRVRVSIVSRTRRPSSSRTAGSQSGDELFQPDTRTDVTGASRSWAVNQVVPPSADPNTSPDVAPK